MTMATVARLVKQVEPHMEALQKTLSEKAEALSNGQIVYLYSDDNWVYSLFQSEGTVSLFAESLYPTGPADDQTEPQATETPDMIVTSTPEPTPTFIHKYGWMSQDCQIFGEINSTRRSSKNKWPKKNLMNFGQQIILKIIYLIII